MLKFKRDDLGLYFALSLVGAGVGLLVGAIIASRFSDPFEPEPLEPDPPDDPYFPTRTPIKTDNHVGPNHTTQPRRDNNRKPMKVQKLPISEELQELIDLYHPSALQLEMYDRGVVTLDDLRLMLEREAALKNDPTNYSGRYSESDKPDLVDLVKLPDDEEIIDDRYQIMQDPPDKPVKDGRTIYWDPEDDTFATRTRQKEAIPLGSLKGMVSEEVWETVKPYLISGFSPVYVDDLTKKAYYIFEIVAGDLEEFPDSEYGED